MTPTIRRSFGGNGFGGSATQQSLGKPGAVYPAAVATDSDMIIAVDRQQTTLALTLNASDNSMTVVDPSLIVAYNLLSIDNEIVKTTAPPAGNVVPIVRGFDGTTPAIHLTGAAVMGMIDAYHHNRLVAEVEAIESSLGPNLSNVAAVSLVTSPPYIFAPQTPGGTLNPGTNMITLTPVPKGVNGTDTNHYLYISGGTGTAEAVPITGGSAVSGAASGNIFVTCANTHSGAWTIQTATAGIQEAHNANPKALIRAPFGIYDLYGTIWSNGDFHLRGDGPHATILQWHPLNTAAIVAQREWFSIADLTLQQIGTATSGSIAVSTAGASSGVAGAAANWVEFSNIQAYGFYNGLVTNGGGQALNLTKVIVGNSVQDGIVCKGSQGYWYAVVSVNNGGNGITLTPFGTGTGGGVTFMTGIQTYNNGGWGINSVIPIFISGLNTFLNNDKLGELYIKTNTAQSGWITDAAIQFAGQSATWGTLNTAPGISIDTGTGTFCMENLQIFNCQGNAITIKSGQHIVTNCSFVGSGQGAQAGNTYSICTPVACGQLNISNNMISSALITGPYNYILDNQFQNTIAGPLLEIGASSYAFISRNLFLQSGAGSALTIDTGSVVEPPFDNYFYSGSLVNNGTIGPQIQFVAPNYTSGSGAAGAITATIPRLIVADGVRVTLLLSYALTGGAANTFNLNSTGALPIRSSRNPASNIATGYAALGVVTIQYSGNATAWLDVSQ